MLDTPHIVMADAQLTAYIHLTIPREEIQNVMGPGISEAMAAVTAQGIKPVGPWFSHHRRMSPDIFDFEICVPVDSPVTPVGREGRQATGNESGSNNLPRALRGAR